MFGLSFVTLFLPLLIDREGYMHSAAWKEMGAGYAETFDRLVTGPVILAVSAIVLVAAFVGALLGTRMLRKHFVRAGLA